MGLQPRHRRSHREGPPVVLREPARGRVVSGRCPACSPTRTPATPKWTYVADTSRPAYGGVVSHHRAPAHAQATPRNKFTVFWDQQRPAKAGGVGISEATRAASRTNDNLRGIAAAPTPSASATAAPETAALPRLRQARAAGAWTSPVNNRLLLEAGFGMYLSRWGGGRCPAGPKT